MGGGGSTEWGLVYIPSNVAAAVKTVVTCNSAGRTSNVTKLTSLRTKVYGALSTNLQPREVYNVLVHFNANLDAQFRRE